MIGSFDCASSHASKFKTVTLQSSFWNVFTHRASSNFAQNAYCSREIYLQCSLQHHRSVKLAAKLNSSGCHCSKITRAFLRKEYCFSSLTCQGGAKKTNYVSAFYAMRNEGASTHLWFGWRIFVFTASFPFILSSSWLFSTTCWTQREKRIENLQHYLI